jgi:hypothetical protein
VAAPPTDLQGITTLTSQAGTDLLPFSPSTINAVLAVTVCESPVAPAESGMSHLVNQRMGERQPMCWTAEGAHLLLQVRCAVHSTLESLFRERYPRFRQTPLALPLIGL